MHLPTLHPRSPTSSDERHRPFEPRDDFGVVHVTKTLSKRRPGTSNNELITNSTPRGRLAPSHVKENRPCSLPFARLLLASATLRDTVTGRVSLTLAVTAASLVVVLAVISSLVFVVRSSDPFAEERNALSSNLRPGMTEQDVIRDFGKPFEVQSPRTGQQGCRVEGYSHAQRPISNRCLVYFGSREAIAYVYIDGNGRVEDIFVGGS